VIAKTHLCQLGFGLGPAIFAISVGAAATLGCTRKDDPAAPGASASAQATSAPSAAATIPRPIPLTKEQIEKTVNPTNLPVYSGKTGAVRGTVTVKGDEAPLREEILRQIPDKCAPAREVYGKVFREGMMHSLADVLVTVTGYDGYLPARGAARLVEARGCAWDSRTLAVMFGQRVDVVSKDREAYLPDLIGGSMPAQLVVMPGKDPAQLYPMKVGRYGLADSLHPFMFADIFAIKFPTFAVTGLDGKYEITGIPVGEVMLNAVLPATMVTAEKKVTIEADKTITVDLEIAFDKAKHMPQPFKPAADKTKDKDKGKGKGKSKLPIIQ
jgi:hypothetical protein